MNAKKIITLFKTRVLFAVLVVLLTAPLADAQQVGLDSLKRKFDRYRTSHLQEKIYVHLDQSLYLTGETMWFKLYLVDGALHKPADISKVVYLEVIDKDKQAVVQTKVAMQNGVGDGSVFLPASITSGNYVVRAYTNWMKNFAPEFYFHTPVTIVNTFRKLDIDKPANPAVDVQFFPEGGNLVSGVQSKVAFRAIDKITGKGLICKGAVLNQQNDTVARFQTHRFGIGNFSFTPVPGMEYRAVVVDQARTYAARFPAAVEAGYTLQVKDSTNDLLSIKVIQKGVAASVPAVYLFIHARNVVSTASLHYLQQGRVTIAVPKKTLQPGISQITLIDGDLRPQCERLYFTPPDKKLQLGAEISQAQFGIRRKVSIDIAAQDPKHQPALANLSVAVYKADSLQGPLQQDIYSFLWLSSDLKGEIESPAYYVDNTGPDVALATDNLMLTHGWRRFNWTDVLGTAPALTFIPEYRGHIITGHVLGHAGNAVPGITTFLSSPSKKIQLYISVSNNRGEVYYEVKDFVGPKKIIVQNDTRQDSTSVGRITIDSPFSDKFAAFKFAPFSFSTAHEKRLLARNMSMQVQDIFYQDRVPLANAVKDSSNFYGKPDATYLLDDYTRFTVMEEVMREYVPGVLVRKRRDGFHFMNLNDAHHSVFNEDPMVLLDGMPVFDIDKIMAFDPLRVKRLDVFTHRYYLGNVSMPGLVSYTTYTGDLSGFALDPRSVTLNYEGLQLQREFYSPPYDNQKQRDSRLPDQRNLLLWAPQVVTKDGKHHLEFYTSDVAGDYNVVIKGMTSDGCSGSGVYGFSVRQFEH